MTAATTLIAVAIPMAYGCDCSEPSTALQIEIPAVRHQLGVLLRPAVEIDRRGSTLLGGPFGPVGWLAFCNRHC
jgi:hypothetical protein